MKDYNVMIDGKPFYETPIINKEEFIKQLLN